MQIIGKSNRPNSGHLHRPGVHLVHSESILHWSSQGPETPQEIRHPKRARAHGAGT